MTHRVLPSQAVSAIESTYSWASVALERGGSENTLLPPEIRHVGPLLGLVDAIPPQYITLEEDDLGRYVYAVAAIRSMLAIWERAPNAGGPGLSPLAVLGNRSPITALLELLRKCPDEAPEATTAGLDFVADPDLRLGLRIDLSNAQRALAGGEYKAATVLAGSCAEALLLDAILRVPQATLDAAIKAVDATRRQKLRGSQTEWHLRDYSDVARQLALIDPSAATSVTLAADYRNLIHPGRALRLAKRASRGTALTALAAVHSVIEAFARSPG